MSDDMKKLQKKCNLITVLFVENRFVALYNQNFVRNNYWFGMKIVENFREEFRILLCDTSGQSTTSHRRAFFNTELQYVKSQRIIELVYFLHWTPVQLPDLTFPLYTCIYSANWQTPVVAMYGIVYSRCPSINSFT